MDIVTVDCSGPAERIFVASEHCVVFPLCGPIADVQIEFVGGGGGRCSLEPGVALFIPAGQTLRSILPAHGRFRHVRIYLAPRLVAEAARASGWTGPDAPGPRLAASPHIHNPEILRLAVEFGDEAWRRQRGCEPYLEGLAQCLAVQLVRHLQRAERLQRLEGQAPRQNAWRIRRAIEAMEERLAETLSLAELSQIAGLSTFHFARQFKLETGVAPNQYLTQVRMARAELLLLSNADWSLATVAQAVGYRSVSQFCAAFRRRAGQTPGAFRSTALSLAKAAVAPLSQLSPGPPAGPGR